MASFWDYFNGSKYYRKRNNYRRELFDSAKAVIVEYKLKVPLEDESFTRPLTDKEATELKNDREKLRASLALKDGYGSLAIVKFYDETFGLGFNRVHVTKLGLRRFTDILAENKARAETNYGVDLIDPAVLAGIVAGYVAGIALSCVPFCQALGASMMQAAIWGLVSAIAAVIFHIVEVGNAGKLQALQFQTLSVNTSNMFLGRSNAYMQSKKLKSGKSLLIYAGKEQFAQGSIYTSKTAGSDSFLPTQAYNPTQSFATSAQNTPNAQNKEKLISVDERTQGRAQYTLGGNEGYNEKNAPFPLSSIDKHPPNHIDYKQNGLKQHNQRLLKGYGELAMFVGSNDEYKASEWLQAVYNADFREYKDDFYNYVESNDFIEQMQSYSKALRFKGDFFSRYNAEKDWHKQQKEVQMQTLDATRPSIEQKEPNPIENYKDHIRKTFFDKLNAEGKAEEFFTQNEDLQEDSKEWLEAEIEFLTSVNTEKWIQLNDMEYNMERGIMADNASDIYQSAINELILRDYLKAIGASVSLGDYTKQQREYFRIECYKIDDTSYAPFPLFFNITWERGEKPYRDFYPFVTWFLNRPIYAYRHCGGMAIYPYEARWGEFSPHNYSYTSVRIAELRAKIVGMNVVVYNDRSHFKGDEFLRLSFDICKNRLITQAQEKLEKLEA